MAIAKLAVRRLIPTPSVMVSNGFRSRFPSASSRVYITPLVTLLYNPEPAGSTRKHFILRSFSRRKWATPASVPPVPAAHTNASNSPPHCRQISGAVPSRCARKLARFSNWSAKNPAPGPSPAVSASARRRAWLTKCPRWVMDTGRTRSTVAPYASISWHFSTAASSGRKRWALHPSARATMARLTPVLPAVPSVTTPPGIRRPDCNASWMMRSATRSLTLPPGLANSHLMKISHPVAAEREFTRIIGVLPMEERMPGMSGGGPGTSVDGVCVAGGGRREKKRSWAAATARQILHFVVPSWIASSSSRAVLSS
mmetsp:Transcript_9077/g.22366  ORF Transcript_9077/g.22366 Transcript_9077/m.22366 type:complete len:313 (-) Transcript_9077:370-1308(-)